jgi:hypothetical protein
MLLHGLNARCWSSGFIRTTPRRAPQPPDDVTVHVVLNDRGKLGYEETDRVKARPIGAAAGPRTGNSAPGRSFTVVRFIFTALPFLTRPKGTPANILLRSAMVLSGRAAQDMEAGSSSFPGVGASDLNLRQLEGMVAAQNRSHLRCNHSTRLTFLSLHKSTLIELVLDPSA